MPNAFRRQHYIPQFIIKNFNNGTDRVNYWDIREQKYFNSYISNVFERHYMYEDKLNHPEEPEFIEHALGDFERDVGQIITGKILGGKKITINRKELETLRIFLTLLSFRSKNRMEQYKNANFTPETKEILDKYAHDGNYLNLWKKEIEEICKCRSFDEISKNKNIDPIIKQDFQNDLVGLFMTIVDAEEEEFILTDIYPTLELYKVNDKFSAHLHFLFPISPTRIILLNHIMFRKDANLENTFMKPMIDSSRIKGSMIQQPFTIYKEIGKHTPDDLFIYEPQKIFKEDIRYINSLLFNEAKVGVVYRNAQKIVGSADYYNCIINAKTNYFKFADFLRNSKR